MTSPKKILVLSVSAGAGHMRAADAICAAATARGMDAVHVDIMQYVSKTLRKIYTKYYIHIIEKMPNLWGYLYESSDQRKPDAALNRLRRSLEHFNARRLDRLIAEHQPDVIVCTHFLPAEFLSYRLRKPNTLPPVYVQVTDFDLHAMWVHPRLQGYFAGNEEVAIRMRHRGLSPDAVHTTGIPIMPQFASIPSRDVCAKHFGWDPNIPTIMMMAGGLGIGGLETEVKRLLANPHHFQLVVLAGRNQMLLKSLQLIAEKDTRLLPMGFTSEVHLVMGACDLAITKPGGLTTAECLAAQLPMIVISPIPGQEERNCDYLLEQGVAVKAYDSAMLEYKLLTFLNAPQRLHEIRERMRGLGRVNAASDLISIISNECFK